MYASFDGRLDPAQAASLEATQERGTRLPVLAIANIEPADLVRPSAVKPVAITTACDTTRQLTLALR